MDGMLARLSDNATATVNAVLVLSFNVYESMQADVRWSLSYLALILVFYLFHSPFRAHSSAASDTYARAMKVLQTWTLIVVACFNVGPEIVREKRVQLLNYEMTAHKGKHPANVASEVSLAGSVFFPVFFVMTFVFPFLHKMKRRWRLCVTYGPSLSVVLLNSLVMAVTGVMHYTYCRRLFYLEETVSPRVLSWPFSNKAVDKKSVTSVCSGMYSFLLHHAIRPIIITPSTASQPFVALAKVLTGCMLLIGCDYLYKTRQGGDPSRGILWADLYDVKKRGNYFRQRAEETAKESGFLHWRQCWRVLAAAILSSVRGKADTTSRQSDAGPPDWRDFEQKPRSFCRGASSSPRPVSPRNSVAKEAATMAAELPAVTVVRKGQQQQQQQQQQPSAKQQTHLSRKQRENRGGGDKHKQPVIYADEPGALDFAMEEGGKSFCGSGSSGGVASEASRAAALLASVTGDSVVDEMLNGTVVSFAEKLRYKREVADAKHPLNKPGMVPWWSSFSIGTAWQSFIGSTLKFLSFDVRTIEGTSTPKVFALHFCSDAQSLPAASAVAASSPNVADDSEASASVRSYMGLGSPTDGASHASGPPAETAADAQEAAANMSPTDVWFDWVADVGDGFNPTYEVARLLAQPFLRANFAAAGRRKALGSNCLAWGGLTKEDHVCDIFRTESVSAAGEEGSERNTTADTTPLKESASPAVTQVTPTTEKTTPVKEKPSPAKHKSTPAKKKSTPLKSKTSSARQTPTPTPKAQPAGATPAPPLQLVTGATTSQSAPGTPMSCKDGGCGPLQHDDDDDTPLPSTRQGDKRGFSRMMRSNSHQAVTASSPSSVEILPRGSFVVVGGDLAYPSPTDETYVTRLFDPYNDAMKSSLKLQRLFHAQQRSVVAPDPFDNDVAHVMMFDAETVARMVNQGASSPLYGQRSRPDEPSADTAAATLPSSEDDDDDASRPKSRWSANAPVTAHQSQFTAAEALHSIPMLFAIPGNHDWFDGLRTFRKYIVEKTWIGGWLMAQRSSYFVLRLPFNWFLLGMDTGNEQDIDIAQRNYFLQVIDKYMNDESCVILTCHEPGWLFNAMEHRSAPLQPQIDAIVRVLGARMRIRLAGDIHNYSRHVPVNPVSEAATLVVSGGGGAYLYGARDDRIIEQGTRYVRAGAFPRSNTYMSLASRLWGFRVINWKLDMMIGVLCFIIIYSILPIPLSRVAQLVEEGKERHGGFFGSSSSSSQTSKSHTTDAANISMSAYAWLALTPQLFDHLMNYGVASFAAIGFFFMGFSSAGSDRGASLAWRAGYGAFWTALVVLCSCNVIALLFAQLDYMARNGMLLSTREVWQSNLDIELRWSMDYLANHTRVLLGTESIASCGLAAVQRYLYSGGSGIIGVISILVRALDPLETLYHLSLSTANEKGEFGQFSPQARRTSVLAFYSYVMYFYWIVVTPLVSLIIGVFLAVSATAFDYMYDGTYSAFQIEDFKHFLRFRLEKSSRQLHCYVVAKKVVPKVWEMDGNHLAEITRGQRRRAPPHLRLFPSRWTPSLTKKESARDRRSFMTAGSPAESSTIADVLEHFVVYPHRTAPAAPSATPQ